ncbi:MAG: SprT family zinc-dependent metalloprotease, partial [Leptolyngbyaceae cyanobacterium bins.59]|nr:SprT family zinc-dependent metalloprotease [Leptolyngbyaceae cyanobacterium bins.59]
SLLEGLQVTVPVGFDRSHIPEILHQKRNWIERTSQRLEAQRHRMGADASDRLPHQIELRAIGETWDLEYRSTPGSSLKAIEQIRDRLLLKGAIDPPDLCRSALKQWLIHKAQKSLVPWLHQLSWDHQLPFQRACIRGQKTRWGSCSRTHTINLNYRLLFLPPPLVRYVLIHELCHTVHLNHSSQFWSLVAKKEPGYAQSDAELRDAAQYVPLWLEVDDS